MSTLPSDANEMCSIRALNSVSFIDGRKSELYLLDGIDSASFFSFKQA